MLMTSLISVSVAGPAIAGPSSSSLPRYSTQGLWVVDSSGRHLVLRGFDVSGDSLLYGPADFAAIRSTGATVVRLPMAWANIEPQPGVYDTTAIDHIVDVVRWAGDAGLLVVLDMHQDSWGPCFGGDGAPAWASSPCTDLAPTVASLPGVSSVPGSSVITGFGVGITLDPAAAETTFWTSHSLQEQYASAWAEVASAVGSPKWLLGYDMMNEPPAGLVPPGVFESTVLPAFYRLVGGSLRSVDPGALLFAEPGLTHSAATASSSLLAPIGLARVVYAPHEYGTSGNDGSGDVWDFLGPTQFAPDLALDQFQATRMGAALWLGEWGSVNPASTISYNESNYVPDMVSAQDADMIGSVYWAYSTTGYWPKGDLTRMCPFAVAGTPLSFTTGAHAVSFSWTAVAGTTVVSLPAGAMPVLTVTQGELTARAVYNTDGTTVAPGTSVGAEGGWLDLTAPPGTTVSIEVTA
ncbi:MAG TPA: cellulase family glycosylhydrolase [Acidimicrobiales bacterium]|nr:cellulase family glycosylhydrolase [Acidimicrobiales bacterium]